jgi:predicted MFS family arabinose efflux permease
VGPQLASFNKKRNLVNNHFDSHSMDKPNIHQEEKPYNQSKINPRFLLLVGFLVGMSVMGIEMATSRLLTPYLGNSLYIWTNMIGIIMFSMTIGYAWGGKIADKYTSERLLYCIILLSALYTALTPGLTKFMLTSMLPWVTENPLSMFYISLLASLPLFVIPFACLISLNSVPNKCPLLGVWQVK